MSAEPGETHNYFNYFTETEEHFQRARGTSLFLLSPLDWALLESWKNSGIPLEAVLRGIDAAFAKWHAKRVKTQQVNSLAFCAQAVLAEAQRTPEAAGAPHEPAPEPFDREEIRHFLSTNAALLAHRSEFACISEALTAIAAEDWPDFEELEQRLTVLEQKMIATARAQQSADAALTLRRDMDAQLQPYRRKMSAPQLAMLQQQFLDRKLLEAAGLPRLSLFYLR